MDKVYSLGATKKKDIIQWNSSIQLNSAEMSPNTPWAQLSFEPGHTFSNKLQSNPCADGSELYLLHIQW